MEASNKMLNTVRYRSLGRSAALLLRAGSDQEDRFVLLGLSLKPQVLVVCHCFRESETVVRIISARKADKGEEQAYWERRK